MTTPPDNPTMPPETLARLIAAVPPPQLLAFIKGEPELARVVFQGFTVREQALTRSVVRQRLARELARLPLLVEALHDLWAREAAPLLAALADPAFQPIPATLIPLRDAYGEPSLAYALATHEREELRAWAARLGELAAPSAPPPSAPLLPAPPPRDPSEALHRQLKALQEALREAQGSEAALREEVADLRGQLAQAERREHDLLKRDEQTARQLAREIRRLKKAEEEVDALRKALKDARGPAPVPGPAAVSGDAAETIREAIRLLQQGLTLATMPAPEPAPAPVPAEPLERPRAPRPVILPREPAVQLPTARGGKQRITLAQLQTALRMNDEALLARVREGIALLARAPGADRPVLEILAKDGIPEAVLTGPLRAALVDGSNIANMSPERRAHLVYLEQVRRSAWEEGYFPVHIIVDASLRHQIDQPDALMAMVERGEIRMAEAGTSADELLIDEAHRHQAVILTNDRMANWPAAKELEKRHVELRRGLARVGSFHRSSSWFHW